MLDISKILVPYDFSPFSRNALQSALNLARQVQAVVHVIHVELLHGLPIQDASTAPTQAEVLRTRVEEGNPFIKETYSDIILHYAVGRGIAAGPIILDYINAYGVDFVIMGTHGRTGLKRLFLGSIAEEIVRHAPCPVLTVPGESNVGGLAFDKLDKILVPTDFSEFSAQALRYAEEMAELSDAKLDLAHAIHFPSYATLTDAGVFSYFDVDSGVEQRAFEHLKEFYAKVIRGVSQAIFTILQGPAPDEIVRHAQETNCDLIVIGSHGLSGVDRFLLGSVASKTIRRAPCPVLVLRSIVKAIPGNETASAENMVAE